MQIVTLYERWIPLVVFCLAVTCLVTKLHGQDTQPTESTGPTEPTAAIDAGETAPPVQKQADSPESSDLQVAPSADNTLAESDPTDASTGDSLLEMIVDSGVTGVAFMAVLGLFSLVAATVALERFVNMRRGRMIPRAFTESLEQLTKGSGTAPDLFAELCNTTTAPIAAILQAGLVRQGRPLLEVEKAMEDAASREMSETQAKIRPLRTVGNVAPLIGLLGTVVGMIIAFHTASQAGLGKAELLAKGIYMALLTTAGGLSVAIPSLLLGSFFGGRLEKFFREIDKHLMPAVPFLASSTNPHASEIQKPERSVDSQLTPQSAARNKSDNPLMSM